MVTTVGTETHILDLLSDLIQLHYHAANAYQAAIDRIANRQFTAAVSVFREDQLRHVAELSTILTAMGQMPPEQGDMKSLLTRGKVVLGGLISGRAILEAMRTNEADINTAYERAVAHTDLNDATRDVPQRALADERRYREWVLSSLEVV